MEDMTSSVPGSRAATVRLLLDVDDVLLADEQSSMADPRTAVLKPTSYGRSLTVQACWDAAIVARLAALTGPAGPAELVWTTTWQEQAASLLAPAIGLGAQARFLSFVGHQKLGDHSGSVWKHRVVGLDLAAYPTPFAWVDDLLDGYTMRPLQSDDVPEGEDLDPEWAEAVADLRQERAAAVADLRREFAAESGLGVLPAFLIVSPAARVGLVAAEVAAIEAFVADPDTDPTAAAVDGLPGVTYVPAGPPPPAPRW